MTIEIKILSTSLSTGIKISSSVFVRFLNLQCPHSSHILIAFYHLPKITASYTQNRDRIWFGCNLFQLAEYDFVYTLCVSHVSVCLLSIYPPDP